MLAKSTRLLALLYASLLVFANPSFADDLESLRVGDMKKLVLHAEAKAAGDAVIFDAEEGELTLAAFEGKTVVLNFWATWCAPCREEMGSLDRLQAALGSDAFEVVAVATGRNPVKQVKRFFKTEGIEELVIYRDPKSTLARQMGILGLPITVVLNPAGEEIARLRGDAEWDSAEAQAILKAMMAAGS